MRRRTAARLSWTIVAASFLLNVTALILHITSTVDENPFADVVYVIALLAFPTVGALIASRHPGNSIGWIFLVAGFASVLQGFLASYGTQSLYGDGAPLPGGIIALWLADIIWLPSIALLTTFLFLLFPDGRPLSRKWRPLIWFAVLGAALTALAGIFEPTLYDEPDIEAPLALPALQPLVEPMATVGFFVYMSATIGAVASLVIRLRRARGEERQQIKWFGYAALLAVAVLIPLFILESPGTFELFGGLAFLCLPASVGVAILKYRLYDIDRIINRTLVYGLVTAVLGAVYVGGVVGLGSLARSLTGQANNALVIAASTLAVAALFGPARRRIQDFIDRRFYRRKYNAAHTLEAFNTTLREQVDLDSLTGELLAVVRDTMQPTHASLWLRNPRARG